MESRLNNIKNICWKVATFDILNMLAHLPNNVCVIGPSYITLVIADNKIDNKNVSSFIGATRAIKLRRENKKSVKDFEKFLKRNACCGAQI
jgi:hypothetical protein